MLAKLWLIALFLQPHTLMVYTQGGISLTLNGDLLSQHELLNMELIGSGDNGLIASTTHTPCCASADGWFFPDSTQLSSSVNPNFYQTRTNNGQIILNRGDFFGSNTGIFRCNLPNEAGVASTVYIGLYTATGGAPNVDSLTYNTMTQTLTCRSSGGPASRVVWRRNCSPITGTTTVTVINTLTAVYESTLTLASAENGQYSCTVENSRGRSSMSTIVGVGPVFAVTITPNETTPTAGRPLTLTCSHNNQDMTSVISYQWLDPSGAVVWSSNTLSFAVLRESQQEFYCVVTVGSEVACDEYYMEVQAPDLTVSVSGASGTVMSPLTLSCSLSDPTITMATYEFFKGGVSLGPRSTSPTYSILSAQLSDVGDDYSCRVVVTESYLDLRGSLSVNSSADGRVTLQLPSPIVGLSVVDPTTRNSLPSLYTGRDASIRCLVTIIPSLITGIAATITLLRTGSPDTPVMANTRISVGPIMEVVPHVVFTREYTFSPLSRAADSGDYVCVATLTPEDSDLRALVTDGTSSTEPHPVNILDPVMDVSVAMVADRILDISPYNSYMVTCMATSSVQGSPVNISKTMEWSVSHNNGTTSIVSSGVVNSDLSMATSSSILSVVTTVHGLYRYTCSSGIQLENVADSIGGTQTTTLRVNGPSPPDVPTDITVISVDHQSASIQWSVPQVTYDPESYIVIFGVDPSNLDNSSSTVSGPTDISLTNRVYRVTLEGLQLLTSYYYRVMASNSIGNAESALYVFNTTGIGPSAPRLLEYSRATPTSHTFQWAPPNDTDIIVNQYQLTCQAVLGSGDSLDNLILYSVVTSVTSDLTPWANYTCYVVATNNDGTSPRSNEIMFLTPEQVPTGAPGNFIDGLNPSRGMVRFSWTSVPLTQRNGFITSYILRCVPTNGSEVIRDLPPQSNNEYMVDGFAALTDYNCSVRARNSVGNGPPALRLITTGEDVPGAPPAMFNAMALSDTTVLFNWNAPTDQLNGVLTGYQLTCIAGDSVLSFNYLGTVFMARETGFSPATSYSCNLAAATAPGSGPPATRTVVTLPSAPSGVNVGAESSTSLSVVWSASPGNLISYYVVYIDGVEAGRPQGLEFVAMELLPYTEYTVEVSGVNEAGESDRSERVTVRTLEDLPGRVQCEERWVSSTVNSVMVRWSPPAQENGITLFYHLRLLSYNGANVLSEVNVTSSHLDIVLSPRQRLEEGVPYTVEVVAENSVGRGTQVCTSTDFYRQEAPPAPDSLTVVRSPGGDTVTLTWAVPTLEQARGFVSYIVTFTPNSPDMRKRQTLTECALSPCNVPVAQGGVVIIGLDPSIAYDLSVTPENEDMVSGTAATRVAPAISSSVDVGVIVGAVIGGLIVVILLLLVVILCFCILTRKSGTHKLSDPDAVSLEDLPQEKIIFSANNYQSSPVSSPGHSPRREFVSPLAMTVTDFLQPVELTSFNDYVEHMHKDRNKGFDRAFQSLPGDGLQSCEAAKKMSKRNRFHNIHPYDETRVKLQRLADDPDSDYINASYVDGYQKEKAYISAQGPLPNTVDDFWRMIWENKLGHIVMLTKCKEGGKVKCEQYWPPEVNTEYFTRTYNLCIRCIEFKPFADYEMRKFFVTDLDKPDYQGLPVTHYLFTSWPDHGVPEYPTALIGFIRRVRADLKPEGPPLLVHCSAGVGRTGTFIVLDTMLERIKEQESVNVYETLRNIRLKRARMVQTQDQFVFIHDTLRDLIRCGDTEIPAVEIRSRVAALHKIRPGGEHISEFSYQFQLLGSVSPKRSELNEALQHYNQRKNRYQDKVPYANSCVYLQHTGVTGGEYINASLINGYKTPKAYIATQAPLETTVEDFWRMVWEFKSRVIVMLCDIMENKEEKSFPYWPEVVGDSVPYGKLSVTLVSEEALAEGLVKRTIAITDKPETGSPGNKKLVVTQFHYTGWTEEDRPSGTEAVLRIADEVNRVQMSTENKPITVMCNDGMGRTGAFICIHAQLERVKTEGTVDVFQFVKSARYHRSSLIIDLEHYIFCHDALADFVDQFEANEYSNFK